MKKMTIFSLMCMAMKKIIKTIIATRMMMNIWKTIFAHGSTPSCA